MKLVERNRVKQHISLKLALANGQVFFLFIEK